MTKMKYCPFCGKKLKKYIPAVFQFWNMYCEKCQIGFRPIFSNGNKIIFDYFEEKI